MEERRSTSLRLSHGVNKLIPKDISEAMGKLPPQVPDLEEAVLGAVMLEKPALAQISYLKPQHFYVEAHKVVFEAIKDLEKAAKPWDMRLVVHQLRENGKLDLLPEGAYFVAELTSKVSSAANIDHHARVIVEMSMKRELIQIASKIHHEAYDDQTDVFKLFERSLEDITFLHERETASSGPERIKKLWETLMLTAQPEDVPPLVWIDQCPVVGPRDHTLIVGKKKSRKSLLVVELIVRFLKSRGSMADEVLLFDTEQGKSHVWKSRDRVYRMTNQYIPIFYLRGQTPEFRREFIRETVANWHKPPRIVVIDGVRDLMSNINDADESTEVIVWLEKLIADFDLGVINILHLNKTDSNPRGHIGTELQNKTIATIEVEYDEKTRNSIVKCESARDGAFENFAFTHGPTGLPEIVGVPMGKSASHDEHIQKLQAIFEGEMLRYKEVIQLLKAHFEVGDNKAKALLVKFTTRGWIMKSGGNHSNNTSYKLAVVPGQDLPAQMIQIKQPDLFGAPPPTEAPPETTSDDLPF